ncbi:hypothetical protein GW17_00043397, partial [Ensete ventricosum]
PHRQRLIVGCLPPPPTVTASLLQSPCSRALPPLLQFAVVPQPSTLPQPLFISRHMSSLPLIADFPASTLLNNCCSPHTAASCFLLYRCFPCFLLPFPSSIHRSLTPLFIAYRSSIAAHTVLSVSPFDAPVVVISSLLLCSSPMPLLLLYR